jgi:ADP-ribose pyrophosphatase
MGEETLSSHRIYEGKILSFRLDEIKKANGSITRREIVEHGACVAIVAVDEEGRLLLVRQHRPATEKDLLEIPAGCMNPGEAAEEAVRRELAEETGFHPKEVKKLGGFYSTPGFCTEYLYLYLATDLEPQRLTAEDTDEIELIKVTPKEARELIESGTIKDAKSIAGLLTYLCKV